MKNMNSKTPKNKQKKGISIGALIVCFFIACGIWLYAQAIDDDINVKTFNQLQVEFEGSAAFKEATGYDAHSLNVQYANISINGTNRELVKYDAHSIKLIANISNPNNGVASIRAYHVSENGERTELKDYQITPAVVTVNVSNKIPFSIKDITANPNTEAFGYEIACPADSIIIVGPQSEIESIASATFDLDYQNVNASREYSGFALTFYDENGEPIYNDTIKNENVKYDTSNILVTLTVTPKQPQDEK